MRLLLISYFYPPSVGGVERQSHLLARALVSRGHEVRVVSSRRGGFSRHEVLDGVSIERVPDGRGSRWQKMATFLAGMLAASARVLPHIDLIQVQQLLYPAAAIALAQPVFQRPLVVRNSGSGHFGGVRLMQRQPFGSFGLRVTALRAAGISLNPEMTAEMRDVGFTRVVEIPNAVDLPPEITLPDRAVARHQLGLHGPVVLYVGRLEEEKGIDLLVKSWQSVAVPDALLVIVGDGPQRHALERMAVTGRTAGSVVFRGAVEDPGRYYAAADVFVLPSRSEGLSNALLEAMAHGLAVIASNVGGNRAALSDEASGCLVPAEDPAALATAINQLLADGGRRVALGERARTRARHVYSVTAMVQAYERLYASLLKH